MKITKVRTKLYNWQGPVKTSDTIFATPLSASCLFKTMHKHLSVFLVGL